MTIGLKKEAIIDILNQNSEIKSEEANGLFEKIAEVITKNNAMIEQAMSKDPDKVFKELLRNKGVR